MRLAHFFIERPRFATVLSAFVTLLGLGALAILPVAQYPEIVPPTVQITTVYPGASADTVARTVATPLEQQINGVENMLYMGSQSTGDGKLTITVTFRIGTDLNVAQMLTHLQVSAGSAASTSLLIGFGDDVTELLGRGKPAEGLDVDLVGLVPRNHVRPQGSLRQVARRSGAP